MPNGVSEFNKRVHLPITPYDVMGYITPGATALAGIFLFELWAKHATSSTGFPGISTPVSTAARVVGSCLFDDNVNWVLSLLILILAAGASYIIGHVIASASAFYIDRIFVNKGYGYPYVNLLNLSRPGAAAGAYYRGLFFWVNLYLMMRYATTAQSVLPPPPLFSWSFLSVAIRVCEVILIVGTILKVISAGGATKLPQSFSVSIDRFIRATFASVYDFLAKIVAGYLNTRQTFDQKFIDIYAERFERIFSLKPAEAESNNYWMSYFYVRSESQQLGELVDNWFRLYSFARNVSTAFFVCFLYCLLYLYFAGDQLNQVDRSSLIPLLLLPGLFWLASFLMLVRFYYLYVCYYSKSVFRAFVFLSREGG